MNRLTAFFLVLPVIILHMHCNNAETNVQVNEEERDSVITGDNILIGDAGIVSEDPQLFYDSIKTGDLTPQELISFAKKLIDVPYKYASIDPSIGLDCRIFPEDRI